MAESTEEIADRMAAAALAWLDGLTTDQRSLAQWPWSSSEDERIRWFYTPTDHGGLPLGWQQPAQQRAAMRMLASGLSEAGYVTISTVVGLENVLERAEGWQADWGPDMGRERGRDPGMYFLRVFGDPGPTGSWSWRFGGHHVSVNILVVDGQVRSTTPFFLGAAPASSPLLGSSRLRPLGGVEDPARDLFRSLDADQQPLAVISEAPPADIVTGNRSRVSAGDLPMPLQDLWRKKLVSPYHDLFAAGTRAVEESIGFRPEHHEAIKYSTVATGIAGRDLTAEQRELLRIVLDTHLGRVPPALAAGYADLTSPDGLAEIRFAWCGSGEPGAPHYYRLQGPRLLAEYDNTQSGANHAHSVWRDPEGDFGLDPLTHHRTTHH